MGKKKFKYCVIGNIKKTHVDADGVLRYGTPAFSGGTKVYLCGKFWHIADEEITVIGHTRGKKYQVHRVPVNLIENVRSSRTFQPAILCIMNHFEFWDLWWHDKNKDRKSTKQFVPVWNRKEELSSLAGCAEVMKVTYIFDDSEHWWYQGRTELLYDNESGRFSDPASGQEYTVVEWLSDDSVMVKPGPQFISTEILEGQEMQP